MQCSFLLGCFAINVLLINHQCNKLIWISWLIAEKLYRLHSFGGKKWRFGNSLWSPCFLRGNNLAFYKTQIFLIPTDFSKTATKAYIFSSLDICCRWDERTLLLLKHLSGLILSEKRFILIGKLLVEKTKVLLKYIFLPPTYVAASQMLFPPTNRLFPKTFFTPNFQVVFTL